MVQQISDAEFEIMKVVWVTEKNRRFLPVLQQI